ncbi:UNVERIFIED_CONTAM: hypothetical protein K2H54_002640 [Gekko kuhli]
MDLESICHEFCGEANELRQEMQNMMLGLPGVIMDAIQQEFRNGEQARYGGVLAPHISNGALRPKCPLNLIRDENKPSNYYRPGDHLIGGLISETPVQFQPTIFSEPPFTRLHA